MLVHGVLHTGLVLADERDAHTLIEYLGRGSRDDALRDHLLHGIAQANGAATLGYDLRVGQVAALLQVRDERIRTLERLRREVAVLIEVPPGWDMDQLTRTPRMHWAYDGLPCIALLADVRAVLL